jgi:hypothetical protein
VSQNWRTNQLPYRGCLNEHKKNMEKIFQPKATGSGLLIFKWTLVSSLVIIIIINIIIIIYYLFQLNCIASVDRIEMQNVQFSSRWIGRRNLTAKAISSKNHPTS